MSQLGMGAMLHQLGGGSKEDPQKYAGMQITEASIDNDKLFLTFDVGRKIQVYDNGQSCCEHRYMHTDDDVQSLVGHRLVSMEINNGPHLRSGRFYAIASRKNPRRGQ